MKPTTMTISDLFGPNKRYLVPLFQRPYVWSRERQWEPLWEDIKNKANELIEDAYGRTLRNHFLGAVVLNTIKTYGRHISAIDVIDGQQRLTTLQLVLIALRDFMTVHDYAGHTDSIRRLIKNDHWREFPEEQYKVWPTISDRDVFTEMVRAQSLATLNQKFPLVRKRYTSRFESRPQIIEAYAYFYQAIETFVALPTDQDVTDPDAIIPRLDAIIEAITHHLELVVIELEDRDDPQIIFETLNARGEPLLPSDLIRNLVFLDIAQTTSDQVETWYQTYWRPYDQTDDQGRNFWKASERQGRINRPRLDLFLFHYLSYKTEHDIPITHLFQEFREWWRKKPQQTEAALQDLRHFSNIFRQFYESTTSSRLSVFAKRLRILDTSTVYPLLLFLLGECSLATTERDGVITDLESYLVRRMICGMTNKNYNRVFISLLRQLRQSGQVSRSALQNHLLSLEGESVRWPTNEEFLQAWLTTPIYKTLSPRRVSMILEALDLQQLTQKQEQIHLDHQLSVEHILPQKATLEQWPVPVYAQTSEADTQAYLNRRNVVTHTIGNLTLLTQPLNSSVSNGAFARKRPEITQQSRLRLNSYFQHFSTDDTWDEMTISKRGKELFEDALKIWPQPE